MAGKGTASSRAFLESASPAIGDRRTAAGDPIIATAARSDRPAAGESKTHRTGGRETTCLTAFLAPCCGAGRTWAVRSNGAASAPSDQATVNAAAAVPADARPSRSPLRVPSGDSEGADARTYTCRRRTADRAKPRAGFRARPAKAYRAAARRAGTAGCFGDSGTGAGDGEDRSASATPAIRSQRPAPALSPKAKRSLSVRFRIEIRLH